MLSFKEFLSEGYEITVDQYNALDCYSKMIIDNEWDAYINMFIK